MTSGLFVSEKAAASLCRPEEQLGIGHARCFWTSYEKHALEWGADVPYRMEATDRRRFQTRSEPGTFAVGWRDQLPAPPRNDALLAGHLSEWTLLVLPESGLTLRVLTDRPGLVYP
jgi:hypothetical protein